MVRVSGLGSGVDRLDDQITTRKNRVSNSQENFVNCAVIFVNYVVFYVAETRSIQVIQHVCVIINILRSTSK